MPTVDFIGATPSKRGKQKERAGTKLVPVPSRSLLDMREKTTWSTNDDGMSYNIDSFIILISTFSCSVGWDRVLQKG